MELALFDFDHTVTTGDSYGAFLRQIALPEQRARARWLVGPWVLAYRLRLISAARLRARVTRLVFQGRTASEVTHLAEGYARLQLPHMVRPEMLARVRWHQQQGHTVALVSGSLDIYLRPWCEENGLQHLICNRLEQNGDHLTGRYADEDCGPHKARHIRERFNLAEFSRIHAYGDSEEDKAMLALAHERWYRGRTSTAQHSQQ